MAAPTTTSWEAMQSHSTMNYMCTIPCDMCACPCGRNDKNVNKISWSWGDIALLCVVILALIGAFVEDHYKQKYKAKKAQELQQAKDKKAQQPQQPKELSAGQKYSARLYRLITEIDELIVEGKAPDIIKARNFIQGYGTKEEILFFINNLDKMERVPGRWSFPRTELNYRYIQIATQADGILIPRGRTSPVVPGEEGPQKYHVGSELEGDWVDGVTGDTIS